MKYNVIHEQQPDSNFKIEGETYEQALENALTELGFTVFVNWQDEEKE